MSISWLGILHIYNIWYPLIRICIISCRSKILSSWTFWLLKLTEVTSNQESVLQWKHTVIDILKICHLILNRIGTIWWKLTEVPKSMAHLYIKILWSYGTDSWFDVTSVKVHINPPQFLVVCTEDAKRAGKLLYSFWCSPLVPEIFASKKPNFALSARNCRECFQRFRAWEPGTIRFHTTRNT